MIKVTISAYGSVKKEVGWSSHEVELEKEKGQIEDALKSAKLQDGRTLFDLVANENGIREKYSILLNGRLLWKPEGLKK